MNRLLGEIWGGISQVFNRVDIQIYCNTDSLA